MSRVIKFRVWHPVASKLFYQPEKENVFSGTEFPNGGDWLLSLPRQQGNFSPEFNGRAFSWCEGQVLEQFTGLIDKNGKEIYEGDVVRWTHPMDDIGEVTYVGVDTWYVNQAFWGLKVKRFNDVSPFQSDDSYEVIGNIHEVQS